MIKAHFRWRNGHWRRVDAVGYAGGQHCVIRDCFHCGRSFIGHQLTMLCRDCGTRHGIARSAAAREVAKAIRTGRLPPITGACVDCGSPAVVYDHRNYSMPLLVEPVCRGCNKRRGPALHRQLPDLYPEDAAA